VKHPFKCVPEMYINRYILILRTSVMVYNFSNTDWEKYFTCNLHNVSGMSCAFLRKSVLSFPVRML